MLYTTRKSAEAALNASLMSVTVAADIVSNTLVTLDKGIYWCADKITQNMSETAKSAWVEHEAHLRGFSSAAKLQEYEKAVADKTAKEEQAEIDGLK